MKNKFKLSLLFAIAIGVIKMATDAGRSKIWYIIAMIFAISTLATLDYYLIAAFLAPLIFYILGTGQYHKAQANNRFNDMYEIKYLDDVVAYITKLIVGKEPKEPWFIAEYQNDFRRMWGSVYCVICSLVFMLPFILTNFWYSFPLLLWVFAVRNLHWWLATFTLFFSYSLLFFMSI